MAKPRPAPPKEAPVVTPEVTPAVEAPKVEAAPEAPVKAPATPAVEAVEPEAVAVVPAPVVPPSPFAGYVPGWMPVEFDSVPDESGRVTRIKGHTWGFVPAPKPGS